MQPHQERVLHVLEEDIPLGHDVLHLVSSDDGLLLEHLDGVALLGLLVACKVDLRERREGGEREPGG